MERDFLGMNGKDLGSMMKGEGKGMRQDSAYLGGAGQWPFANKISALQQFMAYRAGHEERSKKSVFDHLSSSGFQPIATPDAVEANYKPSTGQAPQKCFSLDKQGIHQFPLHAYQSQSISCSGGPAHQSNEAKATPVVMQHPIPVATSAPFFNAHGSPYGPNFTVTTSKQQPLGGIVSGSPSVGSMVGAFAPRNVSKLPALTAQVAQLTIFYAGSVNVYDDVPLDKAQAIMFLASKGSNVPSNAMNPRTEAPVLTHTKVAGLEGLGMNQTQTQTQTPNHVASTCSGVSSTISATSHTGTHSGSGCSTTDDMAAAKSIGPLAPTNQHEPSKNTTAPLGSAAPVSVMPRAIPQARKASLTRFLEKRKERVTSAAPYSSAKKPSENAVGFDGPTSKSSSADIPLAGSREELWSFGCQPKNNAGGGEYPSTKLEM